MVKTCQQIDIEQGFNLKVSEQLIHCAGYEMFRTPIASCVGGPG